MPFRPLFLCSIILASVICFGCGETRSPSSAVAGFSEDRPDRGAEGENHGVGGEAPAFPGNLSPGEAEALGVIESRGALEVAMRSKPGVYEPAGDDAKGFQYRLAAELASLLGVELRITVVDSVSAYFDRSSPADPARLPVDVDLYADIITILPEREKLVRFIPTVPVKQLFITRKGDQFESVSEIVDKRVAMAPGTSYEARFLYTADQVGFRPRFVYVSTTADMYEAVARGSADVTLQDSILGLKIVRDHENLALGNPLGEKQFLGWAVAPGNTGLASLVGRFLRYVQETGLWEEYWIASFEIGYIEYLELVGL